MKTYLVNLTYLAVLAVGTVKADSAIALSTADGFVYSVSYDHPDITTARQTAMARCMKEGGSDCEVVLTCNNEGYGSFYVRKAGIGEPVEAYAVVCGYSDPLAAAAEARRNCEFQIARNLNAISSGEYDDWSFPMIRKAIAQSCPALGNCSCDEHSRWYDSDPG